MIAVKKNLVSIAQKEDTKKRNEDVHMFETKRSFIR